MQALHSHIAGSSGLWVAPELRMNAEDKAPDDSTEPEPVRRLDWETGEGEMIYSFYEFWHYDLALAQMLKYLLPDQQNWIPN